MSSQFVKNISKYRGKVQGELALAAAKAAAKAAAHIGSSSPQVNPLLSDFCWQQEVVPASDGVRPILGRG